LKTKYVREHYKKKYKRRKYTQYKKEDISNWRIIPGHLVDRRKLINGRNKQ
jgi:hypothetical protein